MGLEIGTPEAFTKQTALMNFYDKMVEEGADERNVDDANYADIQTQLRNIDDVGEALDLLTGAIQEDLIGKSDSTTLTNFLECFKRTRPPKEF